MKRMANGNKAAMEAAFKDMAKDGGFDYIFDIEIGEKMMINDLVAGKEITEYDFD